MKYIGCMILLHAVILTQANILSKSDDGSECIVLTRQTQTRYVPYRETYKRWRLFYYKISERTNYKLEHFPIWVKEKKCCDGYKSKLNICQPVCSNPCENGVCKWPDKCQCLPGFVPVSNLSHVCIPECETDCANGVCHSPNQCLCIPGYTATDDNLHCVPDCPQGCPTNGHCAGPNACACDSGYAYYLTEINAEECRPKCTVPCQHGKCTAPNVCTCNEGYKPDPTDQYTCIPVCRDGCTYGICTEPNVCACMSGYKPKNDSVCEPICSEPCRMGTCIAPESCVCVEGYGLTESSKYVCQPICERNCVNGKCIAPGNCVCNEGYWFNGTEEEERICKPFCKVPCEPHGTCDAPDTCNCFEGYRMIGTGGQDNDVFINATELTSACEPVCNRGCVHGKCTAPGVCSCDAGYSPSTNDSNVCEPICGTPCGPNSLCAGPNTCACLPNHKLMENDIARGCEPICEPACGPNSICTAPNVCTCNEGYVYDEKDQCTPVCNSTCQNSTCVSPNRCQCWDNFIPLAPSLCVPLCENGCENGECVAPNECRCHNGFVKNETESCVEPCSRSCKDRGVCVHKDKPCECFYGWTGWDCDNHTICILVLNADDERLNRITVYNETNSTTLDARLNATYCHECNQAVANESLCYAMPAVDGSRFTVGCLVKMEPPCNVSNALPILTMKGIQAGVPIFFMAIVLVATYFVIRKRGKQKMQTAIVQRALQDSALDVALLLEEPPIQGIFHEEVKFEPSRNKNRNGRDCLTTPDGEST